MQVDPRLSAPKLECLLMGKPPMEPSPGDEQEEWFTCILGGMMSALSDRRRPMKPDCTRRRCESGEDGPVGVEVSE